MSVCGGCGYQSCQCDRVEGKLLEANVFVEVPDLKCPECSGPLSLAISAWETNTGEPVEWYVSCADDEEDEDEECDDESPHRYYQSDWQPVIDQAEAWGKAQGFRVPS